MHLGVVHGGDNVARFEDVQGGQVAAHEDVRHDEPFAHHVLRLHVLDQVRAIERHDDVHAQVHDHQSAEDVEGHVLEGGVHDAHVRGVGGELEALLAHLGTVPVPDLHGVVDPDLREHVVHAHLHVHPFLPQLSVVVHREAIYRAHHVRALERRTGHRAPGQHLLDVHAARVALVAEVLLEVLRSHLEVFEPEELRVVHDVLHRSHELLPHSVVAHDRHGVPDAVRGPRGDPRGVHPDHLAAVHQRTPRVARVDRRVRLVEVVLLAADDALAHFQVRHPHRVAQREGLHPRRDLDPPRVQTAILLVLVPLHSQHRQIEEGADTEHYRGVLAVTLRGHLHEHVRSVRHDVRARQDVTLLVHEEPRPRRLVRLRALERHRPVEGDVVRQDPHDGFVKGREIRHEGRGRALILDAEY